MNILELTRGITVKQGLMRENEQHEIRIIANAYHPHVSGRLPVMSIGAFRRDTGPTEIWDWICGVEDECPGVYNYYWTSNPCDIRHTPEGYTCTRDSWISRRTSVLVDCDAVKHVSVDDIVLDDKGKPYKRTSSEKEKSHTVTAMRLLVDRLGRDIGLAPDNIMVVDSGSGTQLHVLIDRRRSASMYDGADEQWRIDQHTDTKTYEIVNRYFKHLVEVELLGQDPEHPLVDIDRSVFSAANLARLPGTVNRKGPDTPSRPWRPTRVLWRPAEPRPLEDAQLEQLISMARFLLPKVAEEERKTQRVKQSQGQQTHARTPKLETERTYVPPTDTYNPWTIDYYTLLTEHCGVTAASRSRCQCPFHHGVNATFGIYSTGGRCWSATECDRAFNMTETVQILHNLPDYAAVVEWAKQRRIWQDKPLHKLVFEEDGLEMA